MIKLDLIIDITNLFVKEIDDPGCTIIHSLLVNLPISIFGINIFLYNLWKQFPYIKIHFFSLAIVTHIIIRICQLQLVLNLIGIIIQNFTLIFHQINRILMTISLL